MWQYTFKILFTVAIVVAVSEIAKRSVFWGAALASLLYKRRISPTVPGLRGFD